MRLMLTLHPQLLAAIDQAKRYDESRAAYIRECIRQRVERESVTTTYLKEPYDQY